MAISKIIADSITDEAVTSAKIAQGTVIASDVADGTITNAKIESVANTKITGVITTAQLAATTGSGAVVLVTSPTLVTPALGTPSALVGTNITGTAAGLTAGTVTTNANLTGHVTSVGNAAVLGSFTSAQLATALSDETGSGSAVFGTSPTFVTPLLGTPTSGTLTNCTGLPLAGLLGHSTSGNVLTSNGSGWASAAAAASLPAGSVVQVLSVTKTDVQTISPSMTFVDIASLTLTITPRAASSKILAIWTVVHGNGQDQSHGYVRLNRAGTPIGLADTAGSRTSASSCVINTYPTGQMQSSSNSYLDSPSTTAATIYKLTAAANAGTSASYINKSVRDNDNANYDGRATSSLTLMEIQG